MTTKLTEVTQPWYRHPWPWILMLGPFVVVVAGVITTYLAVKSNDGLVDDDYYKQGLAVNQLTARDQLAVRLGLQAEVMQNVEDGKIRVLLRGKPDAVLPEQLQLRAVHPTRAGVDQAVIMRADGAGSYSGKLGAPLKGRWHIALEDGKSQWRLTGDWITEKSASLRLPDEAGAAAGPGGETDNKGG